VPQRFRRAAYIVLAIAFVGLFVGPDAWRFFRLLFFPEPPHWMQYRAASSSYEESCRNFVAVELVALDVRLKRSPLTSNIRECWIEKQWFLDKRGVVNTRDGVQICLRIEGFRNPTIKLESGEFFGSLSGSERSLYYVNCNVPGAARLVFADEDEWPRKVSEKKPNVAIFRRGLELRLEPLE